MKLGGSLGNIPKKLKKKKLVITSNHTWLRFTENTNES
jgi:hypothetical protein